LDVLATRVTMGVITGEMLVDGRLRDESFQRKTGYVQQQDLHLGTATVREALTFSALLRQPKSIPKQDKLDYVEEVIGLLDMQEYADAVIGEIGEGLNVEQRKRLTIGVELAAKPALLLFLDEPTSGLDSQTSWSICDLMEKLVKNGQAILCTIHQPSAMLFQRFDRLLLLAKGGRTVYFGEIGKNSQTLVDYFTGNGAPSLPEGANPAEWMLGVIGAARGSLKTDIDWPQIWRGSPEKVAVEAELDRLALTKSAAKQTLNDAELTAEFAAPLTDQVVIVTRRIFQQYWRSPSYLASKAFLGIGSVSQIATTHRTHAKYFTDVLHRFHILPGYPHTTRPSFSAVRHIRPIYHFHVFRGANHPLLCDVAIALRSPRKAIKNLFMGCFRHRKYHRRNSLEYGKSKRFVMSTSILTAKGCRHLHVHSLVVSLGLL
jgi:ATP-binding cassette, subfamily G (WHITE), member 2, PDR